ncbi:MAG: hypothetical protein CVU71_03650 [Deltaproteobacteria bacterium HGW-Deltaproteobacteria-6]|jgi:hypothetical protein|nr:MAG: hypothetical protein CVU71_03650 [Deltaproteobacteria bacterium HGW-Deltaproteobacteria-6]
MSIEDLIRDAQLKANRVKLGIGFPCNYGVVPSAFLKSVLMMKKPDYELILVEEGDLCTMRNQIVDIARASECTHLLMMDTDMLYHEDTIYRLLSHKLPIIGALCYRRKIPFDPLMFKGKLGGYKSIDEWDKELVEVDATGTGCLMFEMKIFDEIDKIYKAEIDAFNALRPGVGILESLPDTVQRYITKLEKKCRHENVPRKYFKFRQHDDGSPIGEDIGFCSDLRNAGYKIFVDTTIPAGHLTTMVVTDETYRWYKAVRKRQCENDRKIKVA